MEDLRRPQVLFRRSGFGAFYRRSRRTEGVEVEIVAGGGEFLVGCVGEPLFISVAFRQSLVEIRKRLQNSFLFFTLLRRAQRVLQLERCIGH